MKGTVSWRTSYAYGEDGRLSDESREQAEDGVFEAYITLDYSWSETTCP